MTDSDPVTVPDVARGAGRVLMDSSPNGVIGVDAEGSIRYANPRAAQLFDYPLAELVGRPIELLLVSTAGLGPAGLRAEFLRTDEPRPMGGADHLVGRRRDGSTFPCEISLTPMQSGEGRWVFAVLVDASRRVASEARAARLNRVWRTLARSNQAIIRADGPESMCRDVCRVAVDAGGFLGVWVGRPDEDGLVVPQAQAGALGEYVERVSIPLDPAGPPGRGPTARALRENRAFFVGDFAADPSTAPWHALGGRYGIRASASLPLRDGPDGEVRAVISLYSAEPDVFDAEMRTLLEALADNMSSAFAGFRSRRDLQAAVAHRSELLERLSAAAERERAAIAADIHDDSVQSLAAVDLRLGALRRRIQDAAPRLDADVAQAQETLAAASRRLRQLLFDLEPVDAELGLVDALNDLSRAVFAGSPVRATVTGDLDAELAVAERRQAARVAKEALTNIRTHARASTVTIELDTAAGGVEIAISDDGVGLALPVAVSPPGHRGLTTMRDRAELAGGWLRIERHPGDGTTVRFWFPDTTPGH